MRLVLALFALLIAVPANAATYRLTIDAVFESFSGYAAEAFNGEFFEFVGDTGFDRSDPITNVTGSLLPIFWNQTGGIAHFEELAGDRIAFSGCSGVLFALCWSGDSFRNGDRFLSSSYYYVQTVDFSSISFTDDGTGDSWQNDGVQYRSTDGIHASGRVTRYEIAAVPLPASGWLMLLIPVGLGWRRIHARTLS